MKNIISAFIFVSMVLMMVFSEDVHAQKSNAKIVQTDSIYVAGVCDMCKERIENAALIKGVKKVTWNKKNQYLTIIYKPSKVSLDKIEEEIAKAGHDTKNQIALDKDYNKLPDCCAYRSGLIAPH